MDRACLALAFSLSLVACGDDAIESEPDAEEAAADAAPCDPAVDVSCPLGPNAGSFSGFGRLAAMAEHVWTFVPAASGTHQLAGSSEGMSTQFALSTNVTLACDEVSTFCTAGMPCGGVDVPLSAGITYYVKACNPTTANDVRYNVFVHVP
jgi:hypothetical protein